MNKLDKYLLYREEMKTGDAMQWKGDEFLSRMIRLWSKKFNHTSLVLWLTEYERLHDRRFLLEALNEGIMLKLVSRRLEDYKGEVWWFPVKDEYNELRYQIGSWALEQVGTKYDYGSLFKNIFGKVSVNANKLFCSEYFYMAWSHVLKTDFGMKKAPRPSDIPRMGIFKKPVRIL